MQDVKSAPSGLAKGSLACGICAIIPFAGWAVGLAAIIMGIIDLVKIKNGEAGVAGKKFDITGIILGVVLPWVLSMIIIISVWGVAAAALRSY
ncbi:MAG: hypothetical protein BWY60_00571 [Actinobacteria bacterium ADurb.Bin346]|nr:MAG: hypothetical protein BWY60_00571 [Actinobacteria bacterium ADurb.Bin346]